MVDVELDKLLEEWEPIELPKELSDTLDTVKTRMDILRRYFASVLGIMKIATELSGKSQGSKTAIKRE